MEVNEYVRTDNGEIAIVTSVMKETMGDILGTSDFSNIGFCNTEPYVYGNIVKHSKSIIDLIEVGDYVNGELVTDIHRYYGENQEYCGCRLLTQYRTAQFNGLDRKYYLYQEDIKSIVTKEQFKSIEYEV